MSALPVEILCVETKQGKKWSVRGFHETGPIIKIKGDLTRQIPEEHVVKYYVGTTDEDSMNPS